ncbi:hypothetical protein P3H15_55090, partial [Rhodococcus sp. T2V]|nr:hypothetical protein [Rhodococcus sp. T2V]
ETEEEPEEETAEDETEEEEPEEEEPKPRRRRPEPRRRRPQKAAAQKKAINGRLEHLRGIALGFRNLDHYILRSLIHSGQLQERINAL